MFCETYHNAQEAANAASSEGAWFLVALVLLCWVTFFAGYKVGYKLGHCEGLACEGEKKAPSKSLKVEKLEDR